MYFKGYRDLKAFISSFSSRGAWRLVFISQLFVASRDGPVMQSDQTLGLSFRLKNENWS